MKLMEAAGSYRNRIALFYRSAVSFIFGLIPITRNILAPDKVLNTSKQTKLINFKLVENSTIKMVSSNK